MAVVHGRTRGSSRYHQVCDIWDNLGGGVSSRTRREQPPWGTVGEPKQRSAVCLIYYRNFGHCFLDETFLREKFTDSNRFEDNV